MISKTRLSSALYHSPSRIWLAVVFALFLSGVLVSQGSAGAVDPDGEEARRPFASVEVGTHTHYIKKIAVSADGTVVLSVADDKTARLWEANSGRLLHTLRVPVLDGHEGQLYAGAISHDGRHVAVGGFTGLSHDDGQAIVYFFETASGRLVTRLDGLTQHRAVENIAFSPDGQFLAIAQGEGGGVHLFDLRHRGLVRSDFDPTDRILGATFGPTGDFAMTTLDGRLWIYRRASQFSVRDVVLLDGGAQPMHVQYSPDGSMLVVGYDGRAAFDIFDAVSGTRLHSRALSASTGQGGLHVVEWSSDGTTIYAGGEAADGADTSLYRFVNLGQGPAERLLTSSRRISDIRRLPDGAVAFSSGEPELGVLEADGSVRWRVRPATIDLGGRLSGIHVSADGRIVEFAARADGRWYRFTVGRLEEALIAVDGVSDYLRRSQDQRTGWDVQRRDEGGTLLVNGVPVDLENRERVIGWTFLEGQDRLAVGTRWSIRLVGADGRLVWRAPLNSEARRLASSGNGRLLVAALSDGTIRWFRTDDGAPVLALMPHRDGNDWVAWTPTGYYISSLDGDQLLGWHLNNGLEAPDFYRAVQFERMFYRPDLVRAQFDAPGNAVSRSATLEPVALTIADLRSIAPPDLKVTVGGIRSDGGRTVAQLEVRGQTRSLPIEDWGLYVNGIPVTSASDRVLSGDDTRGFVRQLEVPLPSRENALRLEAFNGTSLGLTETTIEGPGDAAPTGGRLLIAAVGVGDYQDPAIPALLYAADDAHTFANAFASSGGRKYLSVETLVISDLTPMGGRKERVQQVADFLAGATGEDTIVLFLAAHGISDAGGNYYFVPSDASMDDIRALRDERRRPDGDSLISWQFFFDALRRTAGRRLLIVDTCSSGGVMGTFDHFSLAKRSMSSSFAFMTAAKADENSQENDEVEHGIFTYGLIEAIRSGVDPDRDGFVTLREAFEHARSTVDRLRDDAGGPQTPQLAAPDVLVSLPLVPAAADALARP